MSRILANVLHVARGRSLDVLNSLWFVPGAVVGALIGLAFGIVELDEGLDSRDIAFGFAGDPSAARLILSSVAGSLITVAGLALSLTVLTLQLVSSQFTPRALRRFMGDRVTQVTAGLFIGVFAYCMLVLRTVRNEGETIDPFVPGLGVTIAIVLALIALGVLLYFIHHVASSIQASSLIGRIGRETFEAVDNLFPTSRGAPIEPDDVPEETELLSTRVPMYAPRAGYIQRIDVEALAGAHADAARIDLCVSPGDFVTKRTPLAQLSLRHPDGGDHQHALVRREPQLPDSVPERGMTISDERDIAQDARYGLRQLVDIALRALSPGINDPSTAITCLGYIRACMEHLTDRDLPESRRLLEDGLVVTAVEIPYRAYLELALIEIGRYAAPDPRLEGEVLATLDALDDAARSGPHAERGADIADVRARIEGMFEEARSATSGR